MDSEIYQFNKDVDGNIVYGNKEYALMDHLYQYGNSKGIKDIYNSIVKNSKDEKEIIEKKFSEMKLEKDTTKVGQGRVFSFNLKKKK